MSKAQREKGKRGEREAAELLRQLYLGANRNVSQARGAEGCDVEGTPWWVEVKRGNATPQAAMKQALRDRAAAGNARIPIVLTRQDGEEWLVTMRWEDWRQLADAF